MKRIMSLFAAICLLITLAACGNGDKAGKAANIAEKDAKGNTVWYLGGESGFNKFDAKAVFADFKDTIDPKSIYSSIDFTEKMLYGSYDLENEKSELKKIRKNSKFVKTEFTDGTYEVSALPISVYMGSENISNITVGFSASNYQDNITDRELALLRIPSKDEIGNVICCYEVKGNKIKFTELEQTSNNNEPFEYTLGKAVFEYEFTLEGIHFTLSDGDESIKLTAHSFISDSDVKLDLNGYSLVDSPLIDQLDYFAADNSMFNYAVKRDGSYYDRSAFKISEDGRITVYLYDTDEDGKEVVFLKQYAYIINCSSSNFFNSFGVILLDGEKIYYYTDSVTEREARILKSEGGSAELTDEQIKEIAEKKSDLYDALYEEFKNKGINVNINRVTGEIAMDSSVLFGGDSAEITSDGKALLNKFLSAYTSIIYNDTFNGFISKTLIEGHTAPISGSTYESGLPLSTERAENVKNYCLSSETGVNVSKLESSLEAVGCSNSKPVYNSDGEVDLSASRRVSFRFIVKVD